MNNNRGNQWNAPELRAAAIDYCTAQMPPPPSLASPAGRDWLQRCSAQCGPQLGLPARELAEILREYRPPAHIRLPDAPAAAELPEHVVTGNTIAAGLADPQETALEALLREEDSAIESTEREALAAALESGSPITEQQRAAVALLLRSSTVANRAAIARGLLQWLCPQLTETAYTVHRAYITLDAACHIEALPAPRALSTGYRTLNRQHIRITDNEGGTHIFLYASASETRSRTPGTRCFLVRSLQARGNQYDDATVRKNLTLLTAYVSRDRRRGTQWAQMFGETRAMVSHRRRRLTDKLNQTGGKSNLPGMKPRRDPRHGTTKKDQP